MTSKNLNGNFWCFGIVKELVFWVHFWIIFKCSSFPLKYLLLVCLKDKCIQFTIFYSCTHSQSRKDLDFYILQTFKKKSVVKQGYCKTVLLKVNASAMTKWRPNCLGDLMVTKMAPENQMVTKMACCPDWWPKCLRDLMAT